MENKINVRKILHITGIVFVGVIFAVLFALVFGFLVKWLWNFLMPGLFGLTQITYLQAFAMVLLAKLLFGGFGSHHSRHHHRHKHHRHFGKWHDRFQCDDTAPWDSRDDRCRHFSRYWQEEGKEAFAAYMKKNENAGKNDENCC
jgi:hypothetical protein